jgi:hypothetical protein
VSMMDDRHVFNIKCDGGWFWLEIQCPYDKTDETRPCWPHEEDGSLIPAPQADCNYIEWNDNQAIEETLHGERTFPVSVYVVWDDGFEVHLV